MKMTRNEFIKSMAAASVAVIGTGTTAGMTTSCTQPTSIKSLHGLSLGVSIYSYYSIARFVDDKVDLEKRMVDLNDMGAEYIEILGEAHVPEYPNPPAKWVDQFFSLLEKYNLKQSAFDIFPDTMFYKDRYLTPEELVEFFAIDCKLASQLGYKVFRALQAPYPPDDPREAYLSPWTKSTQATKFLELAIPYAEKYDVKIALELHSPAQIKSQWIDSMLELIKSTKTQHLGFCPDFGMFFSRPVRGTVENYVKQGAKKEIIEYIISAYQQNLGPAKTVEEVKKMGGGEIEQQYAGVGGIYHSSNNDPKDLSIIAPWIYHTHAKFYDMMEDLTEYSINYPAVLKEYVRNGITGVLSSEYEGMNPEYSVSTSLRMHHAMIRNILAYL
jgi:sugar phosphate isomerase/epimerase